MENQTEIKNEKEFLKMSKKLTDQKLREWEGFVNAQMELLKNYSMQIHQRCLNKLVELKDE